MPEIPEESLKGLYDELEKVGKVDLKNINSEELKKAAKELDRLSLSIKQIEEAAKSTLEKVTGLVSDLGAIGLPFAGAMEKGLKKTKAMESAFGKLSAYGIPGMTNATNKMGGAFGIAAGQIVQVTKAMVQFMMEMTKFRTEISVSMASLGGGLWDIKDKMATLYLTQSVMMEKYGLKAEEVTKTMKSLISSGIDPVKKATFAVLSHFVKLQLGLGLSRESLSSTAKILSQNFGVEIKKLHSNIIKLTVGYQRLRMTSSDYLQMVSNLTMGFINFGTSANEVSITLRNSASSLKLGVERAKIYTREMIGGPRQAGVGQRAWLSEQMGLGGGIGGAMQLAYGKDVAANLGKSFIEVAQREMGLGDVGKMKGREKWEAAGQIALFAKQFGISERTVMESLKMDIKNQVNPAKETAKNTAELVKLANSTLKDIEKQRDIFSTVRDIFKAAPTRIKSLYEQAGLKHTGGEILKKHTGGGIPKLPSFQMGGEVPILAKAHEYMIREESVTPATKPLLENINQYGERGMGTGGGSLNVEVNLPILQPYIQEAINNALRENPNLLMFG
jgi:hypothetical protein